jgi:hypothetical protein
MIRRGKKRLLIERHQEKWLFSTVTTHSAATITVGKNAFCHNLTDRIII